MKKFFIFMLMALPMVFASCSSDDEEDGDSNELMFIQVKLQTDDDSSPLTALYYRYAESITSTHFIYYTHGMFWAYARRTTEDTIFPLSGEYGIDMIDAKDGTFHYTFYLDDYGIERWNNETFVVSVKVDGNTFHHKFKANQSKVVYANYDSDTETITWKVENYK